MVEEQCEVVAEGSWGSFVHLTVDGQNNVIFLDDGQVGADEAVVADGETTTVVVEEPAPPQVMTRRSAAAPATRQRVAAVATPKTKVTRRSVAAAAAAAAAAGSASPMASSSSGEVDLLSFVHNAGVMVNKFSNPCLKMSF